MIGGNYISKSGAKHILTYEYRGSDASLYYKYVVSPCAQWLVDHLFPTWLAPNTITVIGLSLIISSYLVMSWYCPDLQDHCPSWVYAMSSVSLALYQILDASDGKQARKTGNSSPLGLLFDHGCDALNCVFSSFIIATTLNLGPSSKALFILLIPSTVFFFATWEEYYTGTLALPLINGPNEGLLIMYVIYSFAAIYGTSFWLKESPFYGFSFHTLLLFALLMSAVSTIFENIKNVVKAHQEKNKSLRYALLDLLPFLCLLGLTTLWVLISPADIMKRHPRLIMWTFGLLFCKLSMHLMLAHLCEEAIWLCRRSLLFLFGVGFLMIIGLISSSREELISVGFFALSLTVYIHLVITVTNELKSILSISCFQVRNNSNNNKKTRID